MRNIFKLIDEMLKLIPKYETTLRKRLEHIKLSSAYTAPEAMVLRFEQIFDALDTHIAYLEEDWQYKVVSMFTEIPVEDFKKGMEKD